MSSRSVPPSWPGHLRRVLTDDLGVKAIAWFTPVPCERGTREARLRIDGRHELVVVRVMRSGLVHYQDLPKLVPLADILGVPARQLQLAIRKHFPAP